MLRKPKNTRNRDEAMSAVKTVGIVGTGLIGASWTALFLSHGLKVLVSDPAPGAANKLSTYIKSVWPALKSMGLDDKASPDNYEFVGTDLGQHIERCDYIQEVHSHPSYLCFVRPG